MSLRVALVSDDSRYFDEIRKNLTSVDSDVEVLACHDLPERSCDVYVVKPNVEVVRAIAKRHKIMPPVFVFNGMEIPYPQLKILVNAGIAGLVEEKDISPLIIAAKEMTAVKRKLAKLAERVTSLSEVYQISA